MNRLTSAKKDNLVIIREDSPIENSSFFEPEHAIDFDVASVFLGPNIYSANPVIRYKLRFREDLIEQHFTTFFEALGAVLPGLMQNRCTQGAPDCFTHKSEFELNHFFEHVCIEFQNIAGAKISCARCDNTIPIKPSEAIVAYEEADVCIEAARVTALCFTAWFEDNTDSVDFTDTVEIFREFSEQHTPPVQDRVLIQSARERGVPVRRLMGRILQLGHGRHQQRLSATKTTMTNVVSNDIAANKDYSRQILEELGLPSPRYERVYRWRAAVESAEKIGYPVVVKPTFGNLGRGVSVGMTNAEEVRIAYKRAREYCRSVLVEEFIEGGDYRMLVINGKLCAGAQRVPAHVVGDGSQTIEQLVDQVNQNPRRGIGSRFSWTLIALDNEADRLLKKLKYNRQSVPSKGEFVYLRGNANTSDGGTAIDVTDEVHPDNRDIAIRAAQAMGLDIAGVDFLTTDIHRSMWETGGVICEINSRPGLRKHMWPAEGQPRDITGPIVDMLFPDKEKSRIPICAVTGTGNRHAVARILTHILSQSGRHVGLVTKGQAFINGRPTSKVSLSLPAATHAILLDARIDSLVIDANPEDIEQHGLGHDLCDICAIVENDIPANISPGIIEAVNVLLRTVRNTVVLSSPTTYDLGNVMMYQIGKCGESDSTQPSIYLEKNNSGGTSTIRANGEHPATITIDSNLKLLKSLLPKEVDHCLQQVCATAILLGIKANTIERSLHSFATGPYGDSNTFIDG